MGFLKPSIPAPPPPAPPPASPGLQPGGESLPGRSMLPGAASLISTSAQGLKRKASTQRSSLIGGG